KNGHQQQITWQAPEIRRLVTWRLRDEWSWLKIAKHLPTQHRTNNDCYDKWCNLLTEFSNNLDALKAKYLVAHDEDFDKSDDDDNDNTSSPSSSPTSTTTTVISILDEEEETEENDDDDIMIISYLEFYRMDHGELNAVGSEYSPLTLTIVLKDVKKWSLEDLCTEAGTHALQFFWTPLDGRASFPVIYYVTSGGGASPSFLYTGVKDIIAILQANRLQTIITSSDGACANDHLLKCLRNALLNRKFTVENVDKSQMDFSMRDLIELWTQDGLLNKPPGTDRAFDLSRLLSEDELYPADKMNINLAEALADYLRNMKRFYDGFSNNKTLTANERMTKIETAVAYFRQGYKAYSTLHSTTHELLKITLQSLQDLLKWESTHLGTTNHIFSYLSTNIVENFFSIIQSKVHFPALQDYANCYTTACEEMIKQLAVDNPIPQCKASFRQAYGNEDGLKFLMADVPLLMPTERKKMIEQLRAASRKGLDVAEETTSKEFCLQIVAQMPPTRKFLSLHQETCKKRSGQHRLLFCPGQGCVKMFVYEAALKSHIALHHPIQSNQTIESENFDLDIIKPLNAEDLNKPWVLVVLDVETTGLSSQDRIIQLAARLFYRNGVSTPLNSFDQLVHPGLEDLWRLGSAKSPCAISASMLVGKENFAGAASRFFRFLKDANAARFLFVAHNAKFDQ
ncbi:hypothetical protein QOT17_025546, partial [Balamuthia mandrillaris]